MLQRFVQYIQKQHLFSFEDEVLLAVSGGRDSIVLCDLMHKAGFHFQIAHCNFHLRPGDCDRDERFVREVAQDYDVKCHVVQFDTYKYAAEHHLSIEEAARQLRYDYFEQLRIRYNFSVIATGHHRDDSTETFFINLLRGTGISGLHGIRPKNGFIVRPLLLFGRDEIDEFVKRNNLRYVEDYTNASIDYRRNQIRHLLMPLLRKLSPSIDATMQQTIAYLSDVESVYYNTIESLRSRLFVKSDNGFRIAISDIIELSPQSTLLFELLRPYGFNASQVNNILTDLHTQSGKQFYAKDYCLLIDREYVLVYPISIVFKEPSLASEIINRDTLSSLQTPSTIVLFDAEKVKLPYHLRQWRVGDRFSPFGMKGSKLVSDYFSDHKFSLLQKQQTWLLVDDNDQILWIVGYRADGRYAVSNHTSKVLRIELISC